MGGLGGGGLTSVRLSLRHQQGAEEETAQQKGESWIRLSDLTSVEGAPPPTQRREDCKEEEEGGLQESRGSSWQVVSRTKGGRARPGVPHTNTHTHSEVKASPPGQDSSIFLPGLTSSPC